jgi:hypothetical protein
MRRALSAPLPTWATDGVLSPCRTTSRTCTRYGKPRTGGFVGVDVHCQAHLARSPMLRVGPGPVHASRPPLSPDCATSKAEAKCGGDPTSREVCHDISSFSADPRRIARGVRADRAPSRTNFAPGLMSPSARTAVASATTTRRPISNLPTACPRPAAPRAPARMRTTRRCPPPNDCLHANCHAGALANGHGSLMAKRLCCSRDAIVTAPQRVTLVPQAHDKTG